LPWPRAVVAVGAVAVACAILSVAAPARADAPPTLDGRWSATPLTVKWIVGDWGPACGPRPSGGGESGASVVVHEEGSELSITGGGRSYSTSTCWEQYPGILRVNHASSSRSWKTTCRTSAGDPRQAAVTTSLTATDDRISFYEAGQYQFVIEGQNCTASVGRYRTYSLVQRAGTPETPPPLTSSAPPAQKPTATKPPAEKPAPEVNRCANPGPPARLDVRPSKKLMRADEEFTFRALVFDASGCPVFAKPTWTIDAGGDHAELRQPGSVHVLPDAPEGEVRLAASVGGRSALVTIEIASSERYDSLLKSGAFNADGEVDEAASVAIASSAIGAASAVAEDTASRRKRLFVGIVAVAALLLAALGAVVFRRSQNATRELSEKVAAKDAARRDAKRAAAAAAAEAARKDAPPPAAVGSTMVSPQGRGKTICPVCGQQYAAESRFCGTDGATLLPLN
jgi:hypothetical protein